MNAAQTERDNAHDKVADLSDKLNSINTITLPNGYRDKDGGIDPSVAYKGLNINKYKDNKEDEKEIVNDVTNLSDAEQKEISVFAISLINQVRRQMGNREVFLTDLALKYSKKVAEKYNIDNWGPSKEGHDKEAMDSGKEMLKPRVVWENIGYYMPNTFNKSSNMNLLKNYVYNTIVQFLFNDAHAGWEIGRAHV